MMRTSEDLVHDPLFASRVGSFPAKAQSTIESGSDTIQAASQAWKPAISQLFLLDIGSGLAVIGLLAKPYPCSSGSTRHTEGIFSIVTQDIEAFPRRH